MKLATDKDNHMLHRKKIYLIGSLRNTKIPDIANDLEEMLPGVEVFDDWFAPGPEADDFFKAWAQRRSMTYEEALRSEAAKHIFQFDKHHIDSADMVVAVMPFGKSGGIELGYCIGSGKPGFILLEDNEERWDIMFQFATGCYINLEDLARDISAWFQDNPQS